MNKDLNTHRHLATYSKREPTFRHLNSDYRLTKLEGREIPLPLTWLAAMLAEGKVLSFF